MAWDSDTALLRQVLVLAMASALHHESPTVLLDQFNDVSDLHPVLSWQIGYHRWERAAAELQS